MLQRQTQTATFWRDQFEITPEDTDFLYNLLLDTQAPQTLTQLATAWIEEYDVVKRPRFAQSFPKAWFTYPKIALRLVKKLSFLP